jgi:hypothetical protein
MTDSPPSDLPNARLPHRLLKDGWWLEAPSPARASAIVIRFPRAPRGKPATSGVVLRFPNKK